MKKCALIGLLLTLLVPAAALAEESDFEFDPETGSILDYTGTALEVVVPAEIDGISVVRIGPDAFKNDEVQLTSIVLPEGLEIIDEDAFHWQNSLEMVDCPDSVRVIAEDAFNYGYFGEEFDWPESLEEIGECGFYGTGLTGTVVLPPNVTVIGESAFGATEIEQVVLPTADLQIAGNAFEDCEMLREIVVPADTSNERLQELTDLFAEDNPDAQIIRPEAENVITQEEFERFGGLWYLNTVTEEGVEFSAADVGMDFSLQLNEDGTGNLDMGDEPQDASWTVDGDDIVLSAPDTEDVIFTERDGVLTASDDSVSLVFGREEAQPDYIPGEPVVSESADDFNGTWSCTRLSVFDMNMPAALFADSMQDYFGFDSLDLMIRGTQVCMISDVIETFTFADGTLISQDGMDRTLSLLDDGMLSCDLNGGTLYYEKISDESTLPALPEEETEAVTEAAAKTNAVMGREAETERITETATEAETERITETATEAGTERITEAVTEAETEMITEAVTEAETERITETAMGAETEVTAQADPEPVYGVKYTCSKATVSGYEFDPSALGAEYTVMFDENGTADLTLAGALLTDLPWHVEDGMLVMEYYDAEPLRFLPVEGGYELEYAGAVRLLFAE